MQGVAAFSSDMSEPLLAIYHAALDAVHGRHLVAAYIDDKLSVDSGRGASKPFYVISMGKAAPEMLEGAIEALGENIVSGLLITKHGYLSRPLPDAITCIESGHPVPDQHSLDAGQQLLDFIAALPAQARLLFLISGGASALVEVLPDGVTLDNLARCNDWLLGSGLAIDEMNAVRKRLSAIKGGRLAAMLEGHEVQQLLISDVPGDALSVIASGMLAANDTPPLPANLPLWLQELCGHALPAPLANHSCFTRIQTTILANAAMARQAAASCAIERGLKVRVWPEVLVSDVRQAALQVMASLRDEPGVVHIWSAEVSVTLPENPGLGGRCQALALEALMQFEAGEAITLLAGATDGSDGANQHAGALVDDTVRQRAVLADLKQVRMNAQQSLHAADSGRYLFELDALLNTGPTGSNVMDLVIACHI